jgi:hypothetical protein
MDLTELRAMMSKILIALLVMIIGLAMILPSNLATASPEDGSSEDGGSEDDGSTDEGTTEDDGWIEGDDDSQGEISSQEELEETYEDTPWEDNVGPNDFEEATNNDNNGEAKPKPYCDTPEGKAAMVCHDRKDYDENTLLYPCNDGTQKADWRDCKDATKKKDNDNDKKNGDHNKKGSSSSSSSASASATATAIAVDVSNCKLDGSADGIQQKFDIAKYQACRLYVNGQKAYTDGFVVGCTQVGNTQQICLALVDSSILNMKTQATQMQTATQPPQTQIQTATQPTQAIQPAAVGR